jgi:hypothetical protein
VATIFTVAIIGMADPTEYREVFLTLSVLAFAALAFFVNSPVLAMRTKEMLLVGVIFLIFRRPTRDLGDIVPIGMLIVTALWIVYRYLDEGILGA